MEEKDIREVDRILERIRGSERKYGEIILVVRNGEVKFVDFRGSAEMLNDQDGRESALES